ncbi:ASCH domain-containing protein [Chitinolyticbacter meiyuanensis]|uniref:ASCH domain-containing protein n=1 Tax=Chitinolyticbacter meiyuanensis TaxID=682798 RepID=UPI0011E5CFD1|nr:ASCH domain-containing protein [Chitinolyticbacter meiyuanensis]
MEQTQAVIPQPVASFWQAFLAQAGLPEHTPLYETFAFGDNEADSSALAALVLAGRKTATASLAWEYGPDRPLPRAGDYSLVIDWQGKPLCVIETLRIDLKPFDHVDSAFAAAEGEADGTLASWRELHWQYFERVCTRLGRQASPGMIVVCERFSRRWPALP